MDKKPFQKSLYDSILHGDNWEKLTKSEKVIRVICHCSIVLTPLMYIGQLLNEDIIEQAKKESKKPWEYRKSLEEKKIFHRVKIAKRELEEVKKTGKTLKELEKFKEAKQNLDKVQREVYNQGRIQSFFSKNDNEATEHGKKVSIKDNILLSAGWEELNKKQNLVRVVAIIFPSLFLLISVYSLTAEPNKFSKILFIPILIISVAFLLTATFFHYSDHEVREAAKEFGVSTTNMKVIVEQIDELDKGSQR